MLFLLVLLAFLVFSTYFECYSSLAVNYHFKLKTGFYVVLNNQFCSHCIYSIFSACLLKKWILLEDEIVIPLWMFERKVHFWLNFELLNELKLSYNILHFLLLFMVVFRPSESMLKLWDFHMLRYLELLWQYGWLMYCLIQFALLTIALSL